MRDSVQNENFVAGSHHILSWMLRDPATFSALLLPDDGTLQYPSGDGKAADLKGFWNAPDPLCTRGFAAEINFLNRLVLVLAGAEHQVPQGFAGVLALLEDELHLLGDGHLYSVLAGEAQRGAGGEDAFGYVSAE